MIIYQLGNKINIIPTRKENAKQTGRLSFCECISVPFGLGVGMWDLIV